MSSSFPPPLASSPPSATININIAAPSPILATSMTGSSAAINSHRTSQRHRNLRFTTDVGFPLTSSASSTPISSPSLSNSSPSSASAANNPYSTLFAPQHSSGGGGGGFSVSSSSPPMHPFTSLPIGGSNRQRLNTSSASPSHVQQQSTVVPSAAAASDARLKKQLDLNFLQSTSENSSNSNNSSLSLRPSSSPRYAANAPSQPPTNTFQLPKPAVGTRERNANHEVDEKRSARSSLYSALASSMQTSSLSSIAPVYYASTGTFKGEDINHLSNLSFNQQLQKIKDRLREQRRNTENNNRAASNMAGGNNNINATNMGYPRTGDELSLSGSTPPTNIRAFSPSLLSQQNSSGTILPSPFASLASSGKSMLAQQQQQSSNRVGRQSPANIAQAQSPSPSFHSRSPNNPTGIRRSILSRSSDSSSDDSDDERGIIRGADSRSRREGQQSHVRTNSITATATATHMSGIPRSRSAFDVPQQAATHGSPGFHTHSTQASPIPYSPSPTLQMNNNAAPSSSPTSSLISMSPSPSPSPPSSAASPSHNMNPNPLLQQVLPVRATGDLLRQRAAAARAAKESAAAAAAEAAAQLAREKPVPSIYASPQTGTHFLMADARPQHIAALPSYLEPFYQCPDRTALIKRLRANDEAKLQRQTLLGCNVIFDSIDPNPEFNNSNSLNGDHTVRPTYVPGWLPPPSGELPPYYIPASLDDPTLVFESRFESGNLRRAIQVDTFEYDLLIRPDINTNTYAQWFYFSIRNTRAARGGVLSNNNALGANSNPIVYKFNIVNLQKSDSLFNCGMQPLFYSVKKTKDSVEKNKHVPYSSTPAATPCFPSMSSFASSTTTPSAPTYVTGPIGWYRGGFDIAYYRSVSSKKNYTLSFSVEFDYDFDTVYIAYAYPYTVTTLYRTLSEWDADPRRTGLILKQRVLCRTLGGNDVPLLLITDFTSSPEGIAKRPAIVITARVHPGETNASWMMKGVMEFLLALPSSAANANSSSQYSKLNPASLPSGSPLADLTSHASTAAFLRSKYFFFLIPCLNPDGVISGNYRCSLAGVDLNRQWLNPERHLHPTVFKTKQLLEKIRGIYHNYQNNMTVSNVDGSNVDEKTDSGITPLSSSAMESNRALASAAMPHMPPPREIAVFCDLHGHSRAQNVFIYGVECDGMNSNASANNALASTMGASSLTSVMSSLSLNAFSSLNATSPAAFNAPPASSTSTSCANSDTSRSHRLAERILPRLLAARSPFFSLSGCHFQVRKSKETTARVVVAKEMGVVNSFTMEASFGGIMPATNAPSSNNPTSSPVGNASPSLSPSPSPTSVPGSPQPLSSMASSASPNGIPPEALLTSRYIGYQFTPRLYEEVGWNLCQALADHANPTLYAAARSELEQTYPAPKSRSSAAAAAASSSIATTNAAAGEDEAMEDSDDDAEGGGDGEVVRTRLVRKRGRKKKSKQQTAAEGGAAAAGGSKSSGKRSSRARSKSEGRPTSSSAPLSSGSSNNPAAIHVKALLDKMRRGSGSSDDSSGDEGQSDDAHLSSSPNSSSVAFAASTKWSSPTSGSTNGSKQQHRSRSGQRRASLELSDSEWMSPTSSGAAHARRSSRGSKLQLQLQRAGSGEYDHPPTMMIPTSTANLNPSLPPGGKRKKTKKKKMKKKQQAQTDDN